MRSSKRMVATLRKSPGPAWAGRYIDGSWDGADLAAYLGLGAHLVTAVATEFPAYFDVVWSRECVDRIRAARGCAAPGTDPWAVAAPLNCEAPAYAPGAVRRGARR